MREETIGHDVYETPALTEYGTIEEWTRQFIDISIVIG
jgi:hypothetical protein